MAIVLLVAILVGLILFFFLGHSGWHKKHEEFRAEAEDLAHQLADLISLQSDVKEPQSVSSADFESLRVRNDRLNDEFKRVISSGAKEDARRIKSEIEALAKDLDKITAAVNKLLNRTRETAIAAAKINREYIALEEKIESVQSQLTGSDDDEAIEAFSELLEMIRDGIRRSSLLSMQTNEGGVSSDLLALQARTKGELDETIGNANRLFDSLENMPKQLLAASDSGLTIVASPGLVEPLLIPLLKARWFGSITPYPAQKKWFLSTSGQDIDPGVLVMIEDENRFVTLIEGKTDLIITEQPPIANDRKRFTAAFPTFSIDSRACSEVIAMDAVALLGHPDSSVVEIRAEALGRIPWVVRTTDEDRIKYITNISENFATVDDPFLAILDNLNVKAMALYHQCSINLRAKYLTYQPTPDARSLAPSPFSIGTEDYGLSFRILAIHSPSSRPAAKQFVDFLTSDIGQDQVKKAGFVDMRLRHRQERVDPIVLATLGEALELPMITTANRYSTNLRFGLNESELDIKAQADIGRLARALARDFANGRVVILGFTDSSGTAEYNHSLSIKRAKHIVSILSSFEIPAVAAGLGQQSPIDSNDTEKGRSRNRRAEVWVVVPQDQER